MQKSLRDIFIKSLREAVKAGFCGMDLAAESHITEPMLDIALKDFPDDPDFNRLRGELYVAEDEYKQAIPHFEKALRGQPENIDNIYNAGMTYFKMARYADAQPLLEKITQFPGDTGLTFMRAFCAFKSGNRAKAGAMMQGLKTNMDDLMQMYPDQITDMLMVYASADANDRPIP